MGPPARPFTGDVGDLVRPADPFFEAQPFGMHKRPHRPHICLDPARRQFPCRLPQRERPRENALAQPVSIGTGQNRLLVTTDLAGRNASSLPPQILPPRYTGQANLAPRQSNEPSPLRPPAPERVHEGLPNRVASSMLAPFSSMELESEIRPAGNPDSTKQQHALIAVSPMRPQIFARTQAHPRLENRLAQVVRIQLLDFGRRSS
ncbi:hypothetical protein ABID59_004293 [Bradyrhizobium sp. S3.3.6]